MYEDDIDYAAKRLNETLVRKVDGSPFQIRTTGRDDEGRLIHNGLNYTNNRLETVRHDEILLEPVQLGFVNTRSSMLFVCRKPMRKDWRQGLSSTSLVYYGNFGRGDFNMKLLVQPITNQYPSYETALDMLDKKQSVAFSRDFGLAGGDETTLVYRKYAVGKIMGKLPVLNKNSFFLQQHLEEAIG